MKFPEIIGVTGTNGAGKDTLADIRSEQTGAMKVSLSDILRQTLRDRGEALERENLIALSTAWRQETGDYGVLATKTIENYLAKKALGEVFGLSVVSLRHPDEARRIKEYGGKIFWVDADPEVRYKRIIRADRGRVEDNKTYEQFMAEQMRELTPPEGSDPAGVNLGSVRPLVDEEIINNFSTEEEYRRFLLNHFDM